MSFQIGLSGLSAASKNLEVIGNNIANAGTVGYKESTAVFADAYAASLAGSGTNNVGMGVTVPAVVQQFTQGTVSSSGNAWDMAINGQGFYRLSTNGAITYSRNGQFQLNKNGEIVNATGDKLTGYLANANGTISAGSPVELKLNLADLAPKTTSASTVSLNLDSRKEIPANAFSPSDSNSFNYSTTQTVYDSLGNPRQFSAYYIKTAPNTYEVQGSVDGSSLAAPLGNLTFNTDGSLDTTNSTLPMNVTAPAANGANPLNFTVDLTGSTQYGAASSINMLKQDGAASGSLTGYSVDGNGVILGRYSNGESKNLGQVALANFVSPTGLQSLGNNKWAETNASGQPVVGVPGSGTFGAIQSYAVEDSNVDLTKSLVDLITAQRNYQANAQTIKAQDQMLQTIVNL